ncbi:hypothetical protein [Polluticoccus soli]|uniref:hypothetical protein n=1 Tax=Polluticoccus soli TaxID=3034150 RepID=UPI0023E26E42|nr:hypothetical protein [Flavipsychrobacter sp. JY13-12]
MFRLLCILLFLPVLSFAQFEVGLGTSSSPLLLGGTARVAYHTPGASFGVSMESSAWFLYLKGFVAQTGAFINIHPAKVKKDMFRYFGFSAHYGWFNYDNQQPSDKARFLSIYGGISWRCSKHIYMNSEWGIRGGILDTWEFHDNGRYTGIPNPPPSYYEATHQWFAYFPATISVNYRF